MTSERLHIRAAFIRAVRIFFHSQNFLEVDTPIRQPAVIPEANITPLQSEEWFLQTSPELCMKRLLALGCDLIFQICPCFRREENGRLHNEEFAMLEWYRMDADYTLLMKDCLELLQGVATSLTRQFGEEVAPVRQTFEVKAEYLSVEDAFNRYAPCSVWQALEQNIFDEVLVEHIEPYIGIDRVTFLYDYPAELASLARKKKNHPHLAERFEMYINGVEIANGFSELTDSKEQEQRFAAERELMQKRGDVVSQVPVKFLQDLEKIDEAAGIALGLDRLLMLLLGETSIDAVRPFGRGDLE